MSKIDQQLNIFLLLLGKEEKRPHVGKPFADERNTLPNLSMDVNKRKQTGDSKDLFLANELPSIE